MDTFAVRLRARGQLTLPQTVRDEWDIAEGDVLTLTKVDGVVVLTPKQLLIPRLTEEFSAIMEQEGVSLAELLQGLEHERKQVGQEQQAVGVA
jgi:AbrB family looped-hinge helix DNA binding protein